MSRFLTPPHRLRLNVANGLAAWSTNIGKSDELDDLEDNEDKTEVENLMLEAKLNELLEQPFHKALQICPELQEHITRQEDAHNVIEEFTQAWGPGGPPDLRDVLRQVLDPRLAALNISAAEAFIEGHQSLLNEPTPTSRRADIQISGDEVQRVVGIIDKMKGSLLGPEMNTFEWGGSHSGGKEAKLSLSSVLNLNLGEGASEPQLRSSIDDLLHKPFDEALEVTPALQKYIADQPNAESIHQEFREHWGPDCQALRGVIEVVLEEDVHPETAAAIKMATDAMKLEMEKNALLQGTRTLTQSIGVLHEEDTMGQPILIRSIDIPEESVRPEIAAHKREVDAIKMDMEKNTLLTGEHSPSQFFEGFRDEDIMVGLTELSGLGLRSALEDLINSTGNTRADDDDEDHGNYKEEVFHPPRSRL